MRPNRFLCTLLVLSAFTLPAFALPGELDAVESHCGVPPHESRETSEVTNRPQRTLIYNDLLLHFQPEEGGWSFTTAWHGHFPVTRGELERRLPCFHEAMQEVAANSPATALDPATAGQIAAPPVDDNTFGIPHFWLIVILTGLLLIGILIPTARQRRRRRLTSARPFRRPNVQPPAAKTKHIDPDLFQ